MMEMKLTIAVITMNRAAQLKEALESCLACNLPQETEFVIIDNASTDDTELTVTTLLENCGYPYYYEKLPENLGVGGGRNYAFSKSNGQYVYVLDDDAVIDVEKNPDFFGRALQMLVDNPKIVTLTTQIYDVVWEANRVDNDNREIAPKIRLCKMFCGGSHFLRKSFFPTQPYLPNKYGYEELLPSLLVMDAGMYNGFAPDLLVIHKPKINKWDWNDEKNLALLTNECAVPYATKRMMYPQIFQPLVWLAYRARVKAHLTKHPECVKKCRQIVRETIEKYAFDRRIKVKTVIRMCRDYGMSVF